MRDWIVIGGGAAGIGVAEILSRRDNQILLLEKNGKLASETTKVFHEWFHSGALYTLVPDSLLTLRYLLGSTDDLLSYYSKYPRMNALATESGLKLESIEGEGWFNNHNIEYRYRIRKFNPIWTYLVSRSINIIQSISSHDWLRKRAGSEYMNSSLLNGVVCKKMIEQTLTSGRDFNLTSPDFTLNSRILLTELVNESTSKGVQYNFDADVMKIVKTTSGYKVFSGNEIYESKNVVICSPQLYSKLYGAKIKTGYAPIGVVDNLGDDVKSFVELDYKITNCVNLINKGSGIGQIGGITLDRMDKVSSYMDFIVKRHRDINPSIRFLDSYVGLKQELVTSGADRSYLYHINKMNDGVWSVVLGKFSLLFSMAPEFYRRIYKENPPNNQIKAEVSKGLSPMLADTSWLEIVKKSNSKINLKG